MGALVFSQMLSVLANGHTSRNDIGTLAFALLQQEFTWLA
jgi:hypothetical protein